MSKPIEFKIPGAFQIPEGVAAGQDFEAMATFQVKKGGRLCLLAVGEHPLPGYEDEGQPSGPPSAGAGVSERYREAMGESL
jgi:hypothetical protein